MAKSALFTVRNNESCPKCGAELVIRSGKHGPFLGCSQYPACDYVRPLKSSADGHIVKVLEGAGLPCMWRKSGITPGTLWYVYWLQ
ncbi:topoisomerase DNA-binding C4 zinc finger domain-containing protein [Escherichia coli]|nr:topoisomerase DNA-binding C4 zinc finger domain-containing protein [Escherichia coli]